VLQGFLYARPLDPGDAAHWLGARVGAAPGLAAAAAVGGSPARKS
jgi:hypothetical protein